MNRVSASTPTAPATPLVIVTGYSGAGKSVALRALEDAGYEVMDNLPLRVIPAVVDMLAQEPRPVAISSDVRSRSFCAQQLVEHVSTLRAHPDMQVELLFLSCDAVVLQQRFQETRRPHPLGMHTPLVDNIREEASLLLSLRSAADTVLDTSTFNPRELAARIQTLYAQEQAECSVQITSFSYRYGTPREADFVLDARMLHNPHYNQDLRPHTGKHAEVADFIHNDALFAPLMTHYTGLLDTTLPRYRADGKRLLSIAVGCTGGKHRSVCVAEYLAQHVRSLCVPVFVQHRELDKI